MFKTSKYDYTNYTPNLFSNEKRKKCLIKLQIIATVSKYLFPHKNYIVLMLLMV